MMKTITLFILSLLLVFPSLGFSQGQSNNWYFGQNAGLTFNSGGPQPLSDGQLVSSEGAATLSDGQGNLLFYVGSQATDPDDPQAHVLTVWGRNHLVMPNGANLQGSSTSTQAAIIVPNPQDQNIYYIFTTDGLFEGENDPNDLQGFNYTTVNMALNGGFGDVVPAEKNVNLLPTNSEKVTAVRSTDCNGIWVITHFIDTFYAYLVDGGGVNNVPVTSVAPPNVPLNGYRDNAMGYLQVSPDGTRLAIAHTTISNDAADDPQSPGALWLYDFDASTGMVSNGEALAINNLSPYGVAFSPDSSKLYVTLDAYSGIPFDHSELYQYDLNAADISASLAIIVNNSDTPNGALQLGPDSRIYRSVFNTAFLDVINTPNTAGLGSNYTAGSVSLGANTTFYGLPPVTPSLFNEQIDIVNGPGGEFVTEVNLCEGSMYTLTARNIAGADYFWTRDGVLLAEADFDLEVSQAGNYVVRINPNTGACPIVGEATINVDPGPVANNATLMQCDGFPVDGFSIFNLTDVIPQVTGGAPGVSVSFFESLMNAENNTAPINPNNYTNTSADTQIIYARVDDPGINCFAISEVTLQVDFNLVLGGSLSSCSNDGFATFTLSDADEQVLLLVGGVGGGYTVAYYATQEEALQGVNQLSNSYVNEDAYSQDIYAKVENGGDCYGISTVLLVINELPAISGDEEVTYCLNDFPNTITLSSGFLVGSQFDYMYEWSTGEDTESIEVNAPGVYDVTITNFDNCSATRTITVTGSDIATFESVEITDFSENNTVTVNVIGEGDYEFSLDNDLGPYQDDNVFENVPPGIHTVYVRDKNNCGISAEEVTVIGYPKFFTPNADGINDTWQLSGTDALFQPTSRISIFDRYGKLITELRPTSSWDGNYNGNPLPSSDYWFRIQLEDGREFKGHFTLKR